MWLKDGGGGGEWQYAGECPVSDSVSVSGPLMFQAVGNRCENGSTMEKRVLLESVLVSVPPCCFRLWGTGVKMAAPWRQSHVSVNVSVNVPLDVSDCAEQV